MSRVLFAGPPVDLEVLEDAAEVLLAGGVVGLPTDTVYGIGACASHAGAVEKLFALKQRSRDLALPVLIDSPESARKLARFTPASERLASRHWPGPLTIVLDRRAEFTADLGGDPNSIGLRIPDAEIVRSLARRCGPLAVTSANLSGEPEADSDSVARQTLGDDVDIYLSGSSESAGRPSTVVDARNGLEILRTGSLDLSEDEIGNS
ncbi:MAG: threonylcarbamoyl-AMP synthase [Acidobacteria bacterium]|nr:MAG: threonylcarbamoyl-AMP synthase [Acidobacteriota bacterium]